jgi:competence protein ComEC
MHRFYAGVLAGCLLSLFLPQLPAFFTIIFAVLLIQFAYTQNWFLLGICCYLLSWHWQLLDYSKAQQLLLQQAVGYQTVKVLSVQSSGESTRLVAALLDPEFSGYQIAFSWQQAPTVQVSEHWQLPLRLKPPHGHLNPGAPHPELQALLNKQLAQGYVSRTEPAIKIGASQSHRARLLHQLEQEYGDYKTSALMRALVSGERDFSAELWQGLRHSGLGHLLVISGLHISLVYGWSLLLLGQLFRFCGLRQAIVLSMLAALLPAIAYAWLAGFAIPTLRAALALLLVMLGRLLLCPANPLAYWGLIVSILLLVEPFWVLSYSFWLSVLAVAIILLVIARLGAPKIDIRQRFSYFLHFNVLLSSLMLFLTLAFFSGFSIFSIFSNLVFVPWCTLVAIPVLLFSLCYFLAGFPLSMWLWQLSDFLLWPLHYWLELSARLDIWWSLPELGMSAALLLTLLLSVLLLLRVTRLIWGLALLTATIALLPASGFAPSLTLFDLGQRTVLLIRQPGFKLLYLDLPAEQAEAVLQYQVLPYLTYQRIAALDAIVIPGWQRELQPALTLLLQRYPTASVYSAQASTDFTHSCSVLAAAEPARVTHWQLPHADPCVLSVDLNGWQLLLPGKLSVSAERELLSRYPEIRADLYLLADYGRDSANSLAFLQQLAPVTLLLAATSNSPYPYPVKVVRPRLTLLNLPLYHSGETGAVQIRVTDSELRMSTERQRRWPRWIEKPTQ